MVSPPMRRGELRIVDVHEFHQEVRDAQNRPVASDCGKETIAENGDPMLQDFLWFLLGDVQRPIIMEPTVRSRLNHYT